MLVYLNPACAVAAERPGKQNEEEEEEEEKQQQFNINFVRSQTEGINNIK